MSINPANFTTTIDNPYLPLKPGAILHYRSNDGSETVKFEVTRQTKIIDGVECVVVLDRVYDEKGRLIEKTYDYFAQDLDGKVWYFGEDVKNYKNGVFQDTGGSWLAGVNGAQAGVIMQAPPVVGQGYSQENAPGIAEDAATVLSLDAHTNTPYAAFDPTLQTFEFTPLDPTLREHKFYAEGIGFVRVTDLTSPGQGEKLVRMEFNGTDQVELIAGNVGPDVLSGRGGGDAIQGHGGDDTVIGGAGADRLAGGGGRDTFQFDLTKESGEASTSRDVIADFRPGRDKIDLGGIDADRPQNGNQDFLFIGAAPFHEVAGELRYKTVHAGVVVKGDVNGDGAADFSIKVKGTETLEGSDFIL
jgi:Ca2+-binding RTX toxin-like protein